MRCSGVDKRGREVKDNAFFAEKYPERLKIQESLFCSPGREAQKGLELLPEALEKVWPLKRAHRESLPRDILELSQMLTSGRADLSLPYWSRPAFVSAYLYYFLPWNLVRLCSLLPQLPLVEPVMLGEKPPVLYDAGTGPLTFIIALWLSWPKWRKLPLKCVALDKSPQPMEIGIRLFAELARLLKGEPWPVATARGPVKSLAKHKLAGGYCWLVSAINILNETFRPGLRDQDDEGQAERDDELLDAWSGLWQDNQQARLLIVEPGTRLGGSIVMSIRERAFDYGLSPTIPCVSQRPCPLLKTKSPNSAYGGAWCHFVFAPQIVPEWLKELSRKAGLHKKSLSLAPLLLAPASGSEKGCSGLKARIISQAFATPESQFSRYCCSELGLGLVENAKDACSGAVIAVKKANGKDEKSGATRLHPDIG